MAGTHAGAAVFILRQDCILLQQRAPGRPGEGTWSLPGGTIERGESWQETGIRETAEEVGLTVRDPRLVGVSCSDSGWLTVWMACAYQGGEVVINDEVTRVHWVPAANLGEWDLWSTHWEPFIVEAGGFAALARKIKEAVL